MTIPHRRFTRALVPVLAAAVMLTAFAAPASAQAKKPNTVIIWGDDIAQSGVSACSHGVMGFKTPNIDRLAKEGLMSTDIHAELPAPPGVADVGSSRLSWQEEDR